MLGFVIILAPAAVLATGALLCLILALFYVLYLQPLLDWATRKSGGFLGSLIRWVTSPVTNFVKGFTQRHIALLMRSFLSGIAPIVTMLNQLTELVQRTYGTLEDMSEQILEALSTLRHETLPREIAEALAPLKAQLARHTDRLDTLERLNQQAAVLVGTALRALPWGVPGTYVGNIDAWLDSYRHLWNQTFNFIAPRLETLRTDVVPQLVRDVERLTARLDTFTEHGLDTIIRRVETLEERVQRVIEPQLETVLQSVDTLFGMVTGQVTDTLTTLFQRVATLETQLEQLAGTAVATLAERVAALETQLRDDLVPRIRQLETKVELLLEQAFGELTADLSALVRRIDQLETQLETVVLPRITALEALLAPAAFAAAVAVAMRTIAPNLFCRNVTTITQRACATDENFLAELLAGTLLWALVLDPRVIARAGQELTGGMAALWRETALR